MRILATLLLTALLCLPASSQDEVVTGYDCECLIDGVSFKQGTLPASGGTTTWQVDAAALPLGMHHVQMRIVQHLSSGISATAAHDALCYRVAEAATHEVTATCRVDGEVIKTTTVPTNGAWTTWTLDLNDIPEGLHHVNVMIADKDRDGMVSTTSYDAMCYRPADGASHEVTATCYVDGQVFKTSILPADGTKQTWVLDLASLPEGLHHVQVNIDDKNKEGIVATSVYQAMCYRPANGANHDVTATCWVDGEVVKQEKLNANGENQTWTLDLSDLPVGLHQVRVDIADKNKQGIVRTSRYQAMCYRVETGESHEVTAAFYVNDKLVKQETIRTDGEVQNCMLNLSTLPEGTYNIRVEIVDRDSWGFITINVYESEFYCLGYEIYDLNGDGSINIGDVSILVDAILDGNYNENNDINGDGTVNIADINLIIAFILNN